ncbi:hypothetical protein FEM48_Zijuj04G0132100 [Ziziphus jujuba var. spinosa]|uniref:Cytochrome b561 and DOMON domain-containing protein n=1 Tax=Ziziphus jujuba var. spinosa TaxID=714518 RepID=A0A978VK34_ZIZJJ|nr:hypothetical protein FEM48_Zijuj04G0132100 [Ziziphus jujuba var. spinosa]
MDKASKALLFSCVLFSLCASSFAQTCKSYTFSNNAIYSSCLDLPVLSSFLHWNYSQTSSTLDIAFRHTGASSSKWVSWAINPRGLAMAGSQALVAYEKSGVFHAYTSPIASTSTDLAEGNLSFGVSNLSASFANTEITIFAKLVLSDGETKVNQVWQEGNMVNGVPQIHATSGPNMRSTATLDLLTEQASNTGGGTDSKLRRKNVHGVLSAVSWGVLLPIGAMMARYLKVFKAADPAWFYLHIACQTSAYAVGVAGWATGLKLGIESSGVQYNLHRNIGIVLFSLGTLQLFALLLRPNKDHKYRLYWNIYHHSAGYAVIILSIINVFEGLEILEPGKDWKRAYIAILICLGSIAAMLEAVTWYIVIKRKRVSSDKFQHNINGSAYGVNGHGNGTHQVV